MSGSVTVKFSYRCLPIKIINGLAPPGLLYVSPTLRQLELSRERIEARLQKALDKHHINAVQKNAIMTQLNRINQGSIVLRTPWLTGSEGVIMNFLADLTSKMNAAGLPLPQDLPGTEFQAWFSPSVLAKTEQQQKEVQGVLDAKHSHFKIKNYKESRIERALGLISFIASWSSSIVSGLGIAVMCVNPPAAMYMFAAAFILFHSDESDEKRWGRAGRYVRRVWDGAYYDVKHTLFAKWRQRLALLGAMILPVIALMVKGMTVTGMLRAVFQIATRIGLAWMLVSPVGQVTASVVFACLAVTRALKALDYDLTNFVVPDLIAGVANFFMLGRGAAARKTAIDTWCEAYGFSFNLKKTEPSAEQKDYVLKAFTNNEPLTFSCEAQGTADVFEDKAFTFCESEQGPYLKRGAA